MLDKNIISIIGSRSCTDNGIELATKFAKELSMQGLVIASGMAMGIDSAAHKGTLEVKGKTIAVLGSGLNNIFPKENMKLFKEIIENDGLVITEYEPDTEPSSNKFLERNRIVSGLSIGILVVEAAYRSGTSVTAKIAVEQERKVFVLPHEIGDIHGVGTNRLIRNGAILVTSPKDIIDEFNFLEFNKVEEKIIDNKENKENIESKTKIKKEKSEIKLNEENNENSEKNIKKKVKKEYQEVYNLIWNGTKSLSELCKNTNKQAMEINEILFMLEIEGVIGKTFGGYKCI